MSFDEASFLDAALQHYTHPEGASSLSLKTKTKNIDPPSDPEHDADFTWNNHAGTSPQNHSKANPLNHSNLRSDPHPHRSGTLFKRSTNQDITNENSTNKNTFNQHATNQIASKKLRDPARTNYSAEPLHIMVTRRVTPSLATLLAPTTPMSHRPPMTVTVSQTGSGASPCSSSLMYNPALNCFYCRITRQYYSVREAAALMESESQNSRS